VVLGATEYDPDLRIETAWLYGNMNKYAYYFTDLLIGSKPPQRASVIVDTGSRLVGFPCRGCMHCGDHLDPAYDVSRSETARWLNCSSSCKGTCFKAHCPYTETYSEGSTISGFWFDDFVELGDSLQKNPPVRAQLGCHTNENKLFYSQRANGIMGLAPSVAGSSGGRPTILQQLFQDRKHVNTEMFSICLATWGGRLTVGGYNDTYHVVREGSSGIEWLNMRASHYYFVFPDGLTMGDSGGVQIASGHHSFGVTIVDSGTTYTYLPGPVYRDVVSRLEEHCREHDGCGATKEGVDCWRLAEPLGQPDGFPKLTFHFGEGSQVDWLPDGYLHERGETGVWCQTFAENNIFQTVLGISWMIHKDIIFDLAHNQLGVAQAACPEHRKQSDLIQRFADASADFAEKLEVAPPRKRGSPSTSTSSPFRKRSVVGALVAASLGLVTTLAVLAAALRSASRARAERGTRLPKDECLVQTAEEVSLISCGPDPRQ